MGLLSSKSDTSLLLTWHFSIIFFLSYALIIYLIFFYTDHTDHVIGDKMGVLDILNKKKSIDSEIHKLLNQFTEISLKIPMQKRKNLFDNEGYYPIVFGYFFGVMDYFKQYNKIDEKETKKIFRTYLAKNFTNGNMETAKQLNDFVITLTEGDEGIEYMRRGRNTFKTWMENRFETSSSLNRLLIEAEEK